MYFDVLVYGFGANVEALGGQTYIIVGASAMLAGYCRLTYSLAVIMLETTQSINNFIPTLLAIGVSIGVAKACNRSLYDYAIRSKQMPLLRNHVPAVNKDIRVKELLERSNQQVEVVESVCSVGRLSEVLQYDFNSIPVVNMAGRIIGMIPKNFVIVLIENHMWYESHSNKYQNHEVTSFYASAVKRADSRGGSLMGSPRNSQTKSPQKDKYDDYSEIQEEINRQGTGVVSPRGKTTTPKAGGIGIARLEHDKSEILEYSREEQSEAHQSIINERSNTIADFTGEKDYNLVPKSENILSWEHFNTDFYSSDRTYDEVREICERFAHKVIDLRPYFIEQPYVVLTTDKLPKCLDLFRHMHLRALPVVDPNTGISAGVITRQDLFAYMSL